MKKVLVINSSPKGKKSTTLKMTDAFIEGLKTEINCIVEYIHLVEHSITPCTACSICLHETPGQCCFSDDMDFIIRQYQGADYVIFSSGIHVYSQTMLHRKFLERLLPIVHLSKENKGALTNSYKLTIKRPSEERHINIHSCGSLNVKKMTEAVEKLYAVTYQGKSTNLYGSRSLIHSTQEHQNKFLKALMFAGQDFGKYDAVSKEVNNYIKSFYPTSEELVEIDEYRQQLMNTQENLNASFASYRAYPLMSTLVDQYNPLVDNSLEGVLEIRLTDYNEVYQYKIYNATCHLVIGHDETPSTTLYVTYELFNNLAKNKEDFVGAITKKGLTYLGEFKMIKALNNGLLFRTINKQKELSYFISESTSGSWTTNFINNPLITMAPWICMWLLYYLNVKSAIIIPLIVALGINISKPKDDLTFFDKGNLIVFVLQFIILFLMHSGDVSNYPFSMIGHICLTLLLGVSLFKKTPLLLYILVGPYNKSFNNLETYLSLNRILTAVWGINYFVLSIYTLVMHRRNDLIYILSKLSAYQFITLLLFTLLFVFYYTEVRIKFVFKQKSNDI